jgi:hypothetical protein
MLLLGGSIFLYQIYEKIIRKQDTGRQDTGSKQVLVNRTVSDALHEWFDIHEAELFKKKIERRKNIIKELL